MADRISDVNTYLSQHLTDTGITSGNSSANVDGSVTPVLLKISPPQAGKYLITRMLVLIRATGKFAAAQYGTLAELTNGVVVGIFDDTTGTMVQSFTPGDSITTNAIWGGVCYDVDVKVWGTGDEFLLARWTFAKSGIDLLLNQHNNHALGVLIQDDLTVLNSHRFLVQGYSKP